MKAHRRRDDKATTATAAKPRRSVQRMVRPFTAMEVESLNPNPPAGFENDVRDSDVLKDQLNRVLKIVNSGLDAIPIGGTARELTDGELQCCKLGLNILKLTLQSLDSLCVCHNGGTMVWPNDPSSATPRKESQ